MESFIFLDFSIVFLLFMSVLFSNGFKFILPSYDAKVQSSLIGKCFLHYLMDKRFRFRIIKFLIRKVNFLALIIPTPRTMKKGIPQHKVHNKNGECRCTHEKKKLSWSFSILFLFEKKKKESTGEKKMLIVCDAFDVTGIHLFVLLFST